MNNKNSLILVDPEFDPGAAQEYTLLIKITTDSYSYAIVNKKIGELLVIFDHQDCYDVMAELSIRRRTDPYLALDFQEVKISAYTANSIFIPGDLFQADFLDNYKSYFTDEVQSVSTMPVKRYGLQIVYSPEPFSAHQLNRLFPSGRKYDHTAPALLLSGRLKGHALLLDLTVSSCNIVFKRDEQLIFSKYFETEGSGELNYYLVLLLKELAINPLLTTVYLSGIIHEGDDKYLVIDRYFERIEFLIAFRDEEYELLDDMPGHYYNHLLAIDLCES